MSIDTDVKSHLSHVRSAALMYARRGWSVIPIPHASKNPGFKGWERLRLVPESIDDHFDDAPQNIGVLLGEPSDWLIDVDLDHERAVQLAPDFLPPTGAIFGRASKARSHWLYRVTSPLATKKFRSKSAGMLVEVRSTGMQTVFPPSTHPSGEPIAWDGDQEEPAEMAPGALLECVRKLAHQVLIELGEKQAPTEKKSAARVLAAQQQSPAVLTSVSLPERARCCLAALQRIAVVDQRDGSHRLFVAACRCVEHDLDDGAVLDVIHQYARRQPFPRSWSTAEILKRVRDAERQCVRGQAFHVASDGCIALGAREPQSGRLVLSPTRTLPTAQAFVRDFHLHSAGPTLVCYAGMLAVDALYEAWRRWCEYEGRQAVTTRQTFGRDLAAAVAGITRRRGTHDVPFYEGIHLNKAKS